MTQLPVGVYHKLTFLSVYFISKRVMVFGDVRFAVLIMQNDDLRSSKVKATIEVKVHSQGTW